MMKRLTSILLPAAAWLCCLGAASSSPAMPWTPSEDGCPHHELKVAIDPESNRIQVLDTITIPPGEDRAASGGISFLLHRNLAVTCLTEGIRLEPDPPADDAGGQAPLARSYTIYPLGNGAAPRQVVLSYEGVINHPVEKTGEEYARSFSQSPGLISPEGAVLSGGTCWYPRLETDLVTFSLHVILPAGWTAVSQGKRSSFQSATDKASVTWESPEPQDEIYLIAAAFTEYERDLKNGVTAHAFLRAPDPSLAAKYLDVTGLYIGMYNRLIGPYPFTKFALVENFWETGYGMPSFTLLGPRVIRFPFILHSSYPHEILHNWWGNGVYVDWEKGNWCEGLTAYPADHLIKEQRGQGMEYRRATLQKYLDYVKHSKDFPLTEFRSRHDAVTEAVGYGKCLMFFHMLRQRLGDELFVKGLRDFYQGNLFRHAAFSDLEASFSAASGMDLGPIFDQWVTRPGAPNLEVDSWSLSAEKGAEGIRFSVRIRQIQPEEPYDLDVPLAIHLMGEEKARLHKIAVKGRSTRYDAVLPSMPVRFELDPRFDVFRRLDRSEIPPSIGQVFGAAKILIVLPERAPEAMSRAFAELADRWKSDNPAIETVLDSRLERLPDDASVWILGERNRFTPRGSAELAGYGSAIGKEQVTLAGEALPAKDRCFVLTVRNPGNCDEVLCWVGADLPESIPGLGRKLPHYGKYSYLAFRGDEPTNTNKGQWPAVGSPLVIDLGDEMSKPLAVPTAPPLIEPPPVFTPDALMKHVTFLADDGLEGRGLGSAGIRKAREYIAARFAAAGLEPAGDDGAFFQTFEAAAGHDRKMVQVANVLARLPGTDPDLSDRPVVVGAHFDHLGLGWPDVHKGDEGKIHNGADDNASGVAVLLELARELGARARPARPVLFAAFTGEESGLLGSQHFIRSLGENPADAIFAMINIDSVGRLEGRKFQILGTGSAREWAFIIMGVGYTTGILADSVPNDPGGSDQVSFLHAGIPAIHVFAGLHPDYHRPTDDPSRLDSEGIVQAAQLVQEVVTYLGGRKDPLTVTLKDAGAPLVRPKSESSGRKVSLGTMPDFAFTGPGVRVANVVPGSAAEEAGLAKGDCIRQINGRDVKDLRGYAQLLKEFKAGDRIVITFERDGKTEEAEAVLKER